MKTVILCGGEGTRLRELTDYIPKPLVEIGGKPILWHIMKIYSHYGWNDFVLCLGHKGDLIEDYLKKNREEGWNITFADTGLNTNTGGRIKKIERYIDDELFFATYGDGLADIDLDALLRFHKAGKKMATITCVNPPSQFGAVEISGDDSITYFREKPSTSQWINGGFFVFARAVFDLVRENDVLEKEPFEALVRKKQMAAYKLTRYWGCMDTFKDMQVLNTLWKENKASWKVWDGPNG